MRMSDYLGVKSVSVCVRNRRFIIKPADSMKKFVGCENRFQIPLVLVAAKIEKAVTLPVVDVQFAFEAERFGVVAELFGRRHGDQFVVAAQEND